MEWTPNLSSFFLLPPSLPLKEDSEHVPRSEFSASHHSYSSLPTSTSGRRSLSSSSSLHSLPLLCWAHKNKKLKKSSPVNSFRHAKSLPHFETYKSHQKQKQPSVPQILFITQMDRSSINSQFFSSIESQTEIPNSKTREVPNITKSSSTERKQIREWTVKDLIERFEKVGLSQYFEVLFILSFLLIYFSSSVSEFLE
jgi:hypothetical protein